MARSDPRSTAEIFNDLRAIAQIDGALHEISAIIYRDWVVTVDTQEGRVVDDVGYRWSTSKLNRNELMLLLGLTIQSQSDRTFSVEATDDIRGPGGSAPARVSRLSAQGQFPSFR